MAKYPAPMLFKVLVDGESCHGGKHKYQLGKWTPKLKPQCCSAGYHLTSDPLRWWMPKARLFLAVGKGEMHGDGSDKAAFASVKLTVEVGKDFPWLCMFPRIRAFLAASIRSVEAKADISWADLSCANLSWADLSRANLSRADLSGANLSWADLSRANLSWADLSWADLSRANLSRANLSRANLSWANLSGADLSWAYRPENAPAGWKINAELRLERK